MPGGKFPTLNTTPALAKGLVAAGFAAWAGAFVVAQQAPPPAGTPLWLAAPVLFAAASAAVRDLAPAAVVPVLGLLLVGGIAVYPCDLDDPFGAPDATRNVPLFQVAQQGPEWRAPSVEGPYPVRCATGFAVGALLLVALAAGPWWAPRRPGPPGP